MIDINEQFHVDAPLTTVWTIVSDPKEVVGCISGAELGEQYDDGSFAGSLQVKFGPMRVKFNARITLTLDEELHEGRIEAQGRDHQGGTRFRATAACKVTANGDTTDVSLTGEINLSGKLASIVESGATVVVSRLSNEFGENLAKRCAGELTPAAASGQSTAADLPAAPTAAVAPPATVTPPPVAQPTVIPPRRGLLGMFVGLIRKLFPSRRSAQ